MELRQRAIRSVAMLLVVAALGRPAAAEPVRVDYYLTFTHVFGDMVPLAGAPLGVGDRILVSLVYDPAAPLLRPQEHYAEYRPAGSITLGLGSGVVIPLEGMVVASRLLPTQTYDSTVAFGYTEVFPGFESVQAFLDFRGTRDPLTLPGTAGEFFAAYPLGFLRGAAWQIGVDPPFDSGTQEFFGRLDPVPEPGTLLLVGGGAALLLARRRRLRRVDNGLPRIVSESDDQLGPERRE